MVINWGNRVPEKLHISSKLSNATMQWVWNVNPDAAEAVKLTTSSLPYSVLIIFARRPCVLDWGQLCCGDPGTRPFAIHIPLGPDACLEMQWVSNRRCLKIDFKHRKIKSALKRVVFRPTVGIFQCQRTEWFLERSDEIPLKLKQGDFSGFLGGNESESAGVEAWG